MTEINTEINTKNNLKEIPFPLLRTVNYKPNTVIKFKVNYNIINKQLKNWIFNTQNSTF